MYRPSRARRAARLRCGGMLRRGRLEATALAPEERPRVRHLKELDKGEAARLTGVIVQGKVNIADFPVALALILQVLSQRRAIQISNLIAGMAARHIEVSVRNNEHMYFRLLLL